MPRPTHTATPEPRRRDPSLRTGIESPPVVVRPAMPVRPQPAPLARRTANPSTARSVEPARIRPRRPWSLATKLGIAALGFLLAIGGAFTFLLLTGQDEVIARIVVGCVLVVVFGTPLLCVIGLLAFYVWAITRLGRARRMPQPTNLTPVTPPAHPVIVGEVVFDD